MTWANLAGYSFRHGNGEALVYATLWFVGGALGPRSDWWEQCPDRRDRMKLKKPRLSSPLLGGNSNPARVKGSSETERTPCPSIARPRCVTDRALSGSGQYPRSVVTVRFRPHGWVGGDGAGVDDPGGSDAAPVRVGRTSRVVTDRRAGCRWRGRTASPNADASREALRGR